MAGNNNHNTQIQPKFKIGAINVNSLVATYRRHCLQEFIDEHRFDVLLVLETKLKKQHIPQFKGYTFIRTDRPGRGGGGTAIL